MSGQEREVLAVVAVGMALVLFATSPWCVQVFDPGAEASLHRVTVERRRYEHRRQRVLGEIERLMEGRLR